MPRTEIVVLSSLAPGADSLVAEVALTEGFTVKAPLPFPPEIYQNASTFVRTEDGASPERLAELNRENVQRQDKYRDLLARVQRVTKENVFVVRLHGEQHPPTEQQYIGDSNDPDRRRLRYYAAGEYNARYCHLLLAIWDDEKDTDTTAGTAAVVEARRYGSRSDVLDGDIGVGLPPGGPTLHLYTRRQKNPNTPKDPTPLRFLLPEPLPGDDKPVERNEREVEGLNLFCRIAQNLDAFNGTKEAPEDKVKSELEKKRLPDKKVREQLERESPPMYAALKKLIALRRRAGGQGIELEKKHTNTLSWLFLLTFLAVGMYDLFSHWHVAEEGHAHHPGGGFRLGFGTLALLIALASLLWYLFRKPFLHIERGNDYRALAEGLRVQFHWNLAGLGSSVPANYMHRQRSELDWIRAAIRAASFPYHRFRDWFAKLLPSTQTDVLSKLLMPSWVKEQADYYDDNWKKNQRLLHFFHKLAGWMAVTGFLSLSAAFLCVAFHFETFFEGWGGWHFLGTLVILLGWWAIGWFSLRGVHEYAPEELESHWERGLWKLIWMVDRFPPARESHTSQPTGYWGRWWALVQAFLWLLVPSLIVTALFLGVVHQPPWWGGVPGAEDAAGIFGGILLLGAALLVAWAEKALYSELAYQYGTMATLFRSAELRLKRLTNELEQLLKRQPAGSPEYYRKLAETQDFLFALGKEALDENAEWLILHRARPLEPVMAG
jgi:hypothetical protein